MIPGLAGPYVERQTMYTRTLLSRSPSSLLSLLSSLSKSHADHSLLFTLSASSAIPAQDLSTLVNRLTSFSNHTVGCLSAPLLGPYNSLISCSLAVFDPSEAILFRSTIPGRTVPQVGRWHAFRKKDDDDKALRKGLDDVFDNWGEVWDRSLGENTLPIELRGLNPSDVHDVIYLSDRAPEGLANSLRVFKNATKLGLIATSTPFITGRPVTLFHNQNIYDSGAVGIALKRPRSKSRTIVRTEFMGATPLSPPMTVTQCEGNMINSLDNSNPTKLLLAAIRKHGMDMETSGTFKDNEKFSLATVRNGKLSQMYKITAGDPSRGNISLDSEHAPSIDTQVQFCYRPKSAILRIPERFSFTSPDTLAFITCDEPQEIDACGSSVKVDMLPHTFLASSENGFVMCRSGDEAEETWTCTVPGGLGSLEWH